MLEGICVGEVDGVCLVGMFGDVCEIGTESLAKSSESDFKLMFETKLECLLHDLL